MTTLTLPAIMTRAQEKGLSENLSHDHRTIAYLHEVELALFEAHPELKSRDGYVENFIVDQAFKYSVIDLQSHAILSTQPPLNARATRECLRAQHLNNKSIYS